MNESSVIESMRAEEAAPIQPIDCGRASESTRGLPLYILFELGWPPNNKMFLV